MKISSGTDFSWLVKKIIVFEIENHNEKLYLILKSEFSKKGKHRAINNISPNLCEMTSISSTLMFILINYRNISAEVLIKICKVLYDYVSDIFEIVKENE